MKTTIRCFLTLALGISLLTSGCRKSSTTSAPQDAANRPFTVQIITEPPTLDWSKATDSVSADILFNLMEGLVSFSETLEPKPGLAESWSTSKDGATYTFKIRKNVLWSDGVPLTAQHFVDSWLRLMDPKTASEYAYFLFDIKNAQAFNESKVPASHVGVKALDDHTLQVQLNSAAAYFPSMLTFWVTFPIRMDVVTKHGEGWYDAGKAVTLGPYLLTEWVHDDHVSIKVNPNYWGPKPTIQEARFVVVVENSTALTLYETGKIDLMRAEIPSVDMHRLQGNSGLHHHPYLRNYYYGFNITKKPFTDVKVRKAFAMAVDKTLFPKILKGGQMPLDSWVPQGLIGHNPSIGLKFNPEAAKKLLAQAGFPDGKGFPETIAMFDTREENKEIAQALQDMWKQNLNVNVTLQNQEWKVFLKLLQTNEGPPLWRLGWGADFPDPDNFMNLFTSYSGNNNTKWKSKKFDTLIQTAARTAQPKKRAEIYDQAQRLMLEEETIMIPLFQQQISTLVHSRVKKVSLNAMNMLFLKYWSL